MSNGRGGGDAAFSEKKKPAARVRLSTTVSTKSGYFGSVFFSSLDTEVNRWAAKK